MRLVVISALFMCIMFHACKSKGGNEVEERTCIEDSRGMEMLENWKRTFNDESTKLAMDFTCEIVDMASNDSFNLSNHPDLLSSKHYVFTEVNSNNNNTVSIDYYKFSELDDVQNIINRYCDSCYLEANDGQISDPNKSMYLSYKDSCVFQIYAEKAVDEVVNNTMDRFNSWYNIRNKSKIPCGHPYIDSETLSSLEPKINDWLNFYGLDIRLFRGTLHKSPIFSDKVDKTSIYYRKYTTENTLYMPKSRDYSPDKRYYVNTLEAAGVYKDEKGKWIYEGGDDGVEIYLTDTKTRKNYMILIGGSATSIEATFWITNDIFVLVGYDNNKAIIRYFDPTRITEGGFEYVIDGERKSPSYFNCNLEKRGVENMLI